MTTKPWSRRGGPRPGSGRPKGSKNKPVEGAPPKRKPYQLRASQEQWERYVQAAALQGQLVSEWARPILDAAAREVLENKGSESNRHGL